MKMRLITAVALIASAATGASAQVLNVSGQFRCVQGCAGGLPGPAFVTQNGWEINLVNEVGQPSRAWIDYPGHIWAQNWNEGAVYSPDGMTIQFDRGTIWQRDLGEPPAAVIPDRSNSKRSAKIAPSKIAPSKIDKTNARVSAPIPTRPAPAPAVPAAAATAFDGRWSVVIMTQSGGCDRAYRYGVRISNGDVIYDGGGPVDLQGHVNSNGVVRVSVSGAGQQADGQGRLSRTLGTGTWHGQGSLGSCAGVWQAERLG